MAIGDIMKKTPPPVKMTTKKIISLYIIFAFLLTSFTGCGKLKNVLGLNQLNNSNSSEINSQPEPSSEIDAKDLTKKESWKEWTNRQWTDNKWYWIGGMVVAGTGVYYYSRRTISADFPLDMQNLGNQNQAEVQHQIEEGRRRITHVAE